VRSAIRRRRDRLPLDANRGLTVIVGARWAQRSGWIRPGSSAGEGADGDDLRLEDPAVAAILLGYVRSGALDLKSQLGPASLDDMNAWEAALASVPGRVLVKLTSNRHV
jgi:hypothetical protein